MADQSPRLSLPLIQPSQAQKHVTHNSALELLDVISQLNVIALNVNIPPGAAVNGDAYAIGAAPQSEWADHGNTIALYSNGGWLFIAPRNGWRLWDQTSQDLYVRKNDAWHPVTVLQNAEGVGINTGFDAVNRLSVASSATLLTHETAGGGHQLKLNKDGATSTASLLFQTGFAGRAEMGTMGNDDFAIKVSGDGSAFVTALSFDSSTGQVSGQAVQQSPDDTAQGRLMRADWGYGPGNTVGPVSQAGGVPTGAIIENGQTLDGDYVRFADGTQICSGTINLNYTDPNRVEAIWTFPMAFSTAPHSFVGTPDAQSIASNASPGTDELGAIMYSNLSTTQTQIKLHRISGLTDFDLGDFISCRVTALGRWY